MVSPTQWYCVRQAAKSILFQTANSSVAQNGYTGLVIPENSAEATQGIGFDGFISIDALLNKGSSVAYSVMGELPEGVTMNYATGAISGTPAAMGEYKLFITYTINGYIQKTGSYTLNVVSAFRMNEEGDALDAAKVGKDFIAEILSDVFTTKDGKYTAVTYSVKEGELPAGLTLSPDGIIEGKPEAAGTYDFVVLMTAEEPSSSPAASSGNAAPTITALDYPMTIVVGE